MRISFSPQFRSDALVVSKVGDVLTINGDVIDLSVIPDGATLPASAIDSEWIAETVERIDGVLHLVLLLPHGPSPEPWQAFPDPISITEDGPIDIPVDTTVTIEERTVEGGIEIVSTTRRWRQEPVVDVTFVPDPEQPEEDE